jgi:hypothetical protein
MRDESSRFVVVQCKDSGDSISEGTGLDFSSSDWVGEVRVMALDVILR